MKTVRFFAQTAAAAVLIMLGSSMAHAQATRTWVSGVGDDANPCSRTAPCKTLAGAISKTAASGEIDCLDPAGVGALTITKSITVDCGDGVGGFAGSVLVSGTNGIVVAAGPNDVVFLRNIGIQGLGTSGSAGLNGVRFISGKALHIESLTIIGFGQNGIDIQNPTFNTVDITNSTITDIVAAGVNVVDNGFGAVLLDNVRMSNVGFGVQAGTNAKVSVYRSGIVGNTATHTAIGINADASGASVTVDNTHIGFCQTGVSATNGGSVQLSNSTIHNNVTGVTGTVASTSPATNLFVGNTSDGTFGAGTISLK